MKVVVNKDEEYASGQAQQSSALKEECEADLAEALPALEAALAALDTLKVIIMIICLIVSILFCNIFINKFYYCTLHFVKLFNCKCIIIQRKKSFA